MYVVILILLIDLHWAYLIVRRTRVGLCPGRPGTGRPSAAPTGWLPLVLPDAGLTPMPLQGTWADPASAGRCRERRCAAPGRPWRGLCCRSRLWNCQLNEWVVGQGLTNSFCRTRVQKCTVGASNFTLKLIKGVPSMPVECRMVSVTDTPHLLFTLWRTRTRVRLQRGSPCWRSRWANRSP